MLKIVLAIEKEAVLECKPIYGVQSGDHCAPIIKKLVVVFFNVINPSFNCDKIFASR